ncbi:MAG TPA: AMMECR1 family protein [bacterium]|uniref:AMMECR1 domain-containing protein n=1 Tax=candidate division TA06 bacterium ADurb.Bin417 TaxID=1852828 RepID=A0A1V5MJI0_UNCT6|nr:MAG: hypothetical protein BWY73_00347 [candidate division TA06 bacterium ADurb.Bin417]HNQ34670.1 AMMECR1 family protein [bacterium]HNS49019.1 AMMECR1 family protein [bacterium]
MIPQKAMRIGWLSLFLLIVAAGPAFPDPIPGKMALAEARQALNHGWSTPTSNPLPGKPPAELNRPGAVFVTLLRNGRVRGCAGSFESLFPDLRQEIAHFTRVAAWQDPRYRPVGPEEAAGITIILTFPQDLEAIDSLDRYRPDRDGLVVRQSGRSGVVLPGEARTVEYAFRKCLRNAGLPPEARPQLYRFQAIQYRETK